MSAVPGVTVVGAGLAGCWMARELAEHGCRVTLIERGAGVASGASGNPAGIIKPVASREPSRPEAFHRAAFAHLRERLDRDGLAAACGLVDSGAVQLVRKPYPQRPGTVEPLDERRTAERAGLDLGAPSIAFDDAAWLRPADLCRALLVPPSPASPPVQTRLRTGLAAMTRHAQGWRLSLDDRSTLITDQVVLACGPAVTRIEACAHLPVTAARGQMDRFARGEVPRARTVVTGRSWLIPDGDAVWAGATYTREDEDEGVRAEDTAHNRAALEALSGRGAGAALAARAGVRATLPDRLPCVGPIVPPGQDASLPGLTVLCGFGSRGIVTTALCARLLADRLCGRPEPLRAWNDLLDPGRFAHRRAGRSGRARAREA